MLHALQGFVAPAAMARLTLLLNHVLASEAVATERLRPHAGRRIELLVQGWPGLLPAPPQLVFDITPAGLFEWAGAQDLPAAQAADLTLRLDATNPAALALRGLTGETPEVTIEGDAGLAGEVDWLLHNLRWDAAADLERVIPPAAAHQLVRAGAMLARGIRAALQGADSMRRRSA